MIIIIIIIIIIVKEEADFTKSSVTLNRQKLMKTENCIFSILAKREFFTYLLINTCFPEGFS